MQGRDLGTDRGRCLEALEPDQTRDITVSEHVLAIVNKMAAREGKIRSGLLARVALSYAEQQSRP